MILGASTAQADASACDGNPVKVFSQPPAGFSPAIADAAELQSYGFPPPPPGGSASPAFNEWLQAVQAARTYSPPDPVCGTAVHDILYSNNWAGHVVSQTQLPGTPHLNWSESSWTQPSVPGNSNYTNYNQAPDASFWTGTGVNYLVQTGADSIATATAQYKFWTEDLPLNTVWEGPVIRPGDVAYVYEQYLGNGTAQYYLENETTHDYQAFVNDAPYDGYAAANFINERLRGYNLPPFGSTTMTGNYFGNDNNTWSLTGSNNTRWIMTSDCTSTGTLLSKPSAVASDTSFDQVWYASSPWTDKC
jgi:hypothetical protein